METTFLEKVLNNEYSENEIARIFSNALDQTIYNMILKDFMERSGVDINTLISKAKATMLDDFYKTAHAKGLTIEEDLAAKLERGLTTGAEQTRADLS